MKKQNQNQGTPRKHQGKISFSENVKFKDSGSLDASHNNKGNNKRSNSTLIPATTTNFSPEAASYRGGGGGNHRDRRYSTDEDAMRSNNSNNGDNDVFNASISSVEDHHHRDSSSSTNDDDDNDDIDNLENGSEADDDGFSGIQSRGSMSSGSSKSKSLAARSSLPCGLSMPILMSLVVLVPIIILIVVTAIPLDEAIRAEQFFDDHQAVFEAIREAGINNFYENYNASIVLFFPTDNPALPPVLEELEAARRAYDVQIRRITNIMRNSDLELRDRFMDELEVINRDMTVDRQRVDSRTTLGPPYRQRQVRLMDRLTRLILLFSKDSRGEILRRRLILYTIVRRIQTLLTSMSSSSRAIIGAGTNPFFYYSNAQNLQSRYDSIVSDVDLIIEAGDDDTSARLTEVKNSEAWKQWIDLTELLLGEYNTSNWAHVTADNVTVWFDAVNAYYIETDAQILSSITDGEILSRAAVREIIIMVIALVACLFALAAVIYYNNKEQTRLEKALDSTAVLAQAVQRFVPKNQLKTMGMRSITQVQAGMTTEVAQTITFSDIREFTRLSESMTRLELFDWLQNYVARMTKVVSEEKSYIMAFLGDGLGICSPQPTYAVKAAIKMHVSVEELNVNLIAAGSKTPVQIGVGIHAGIVVAGVFGDANRLSCTMIAPDVNFASRLEALTKSFGVKILASDTVIDQISSEVFSYRKVGKVQVKGSKKATPVYDIFQADSLNVKEFKETTKVDFERAIDELDANRPEADRIFEHLSMQARMQGLYDKTVELYRRHRVETGGNSDGESVLSFEKDGSFANSPTLRTNNHSFANYGNNNSFSVENNNNTSNLPSSPLMSGDAVAYNPATSHQAQAQAKSNNNSNSNQHQHMLSSNNNINNNAPPPFAERTVNSERGLYDEHQQVAAGKADEALPNFIIAEQRHEQQQQQQPRRLPPIDNDYNTDIVSSGHRLVQQQQHQHRSANSDGPCPEEVDVINEDIPGETNSVTASLPASATPAPHVKNTQLPHHQPQQHWYDNTAKSEFTDTNRSTNTDRPPTPKNAITTPSAQPHNNHHHHNQHQQVYFRGMNNVSSSNNGSAHATVDRNSQYQMTNDTNTFDRTGTDNNNNNRIPQINHHELHGSSPNRMM